MKYSLIILILVMSVLVYADVNNDLDKPATVNSGATLQIFKTANCQYMTDWTIEAIVRCLTTERTSTSSYTYNYYMTSDKDEKYYNADGYSAYGIDHWDSSKDLEIGKQLAKDLNIYLDRFPACKNLLNEDLHAGSTATFNIYEGTATGTDTETAGGMTCQRSIKDGNTIMDSSKALEATLYVGRGLSAHDRAEVTIRTSTATYRVYSDDPIVLDLDGDGELEASKGNYLPHSLCIPESELVAFDMNADGFDELVEWVGANDGLLVHDITNNEVSGKNLFGDINGFKDGFEQLATLDANKDDALTGEELAGLAVWQDKNRNAKIDNGELHTLESLGITKLNVKAIELKATFERNGKYYMMWDWNPVTIMVKKTK